MGINYLKFMKTSKFREPQIFAITKSKKITESNHYVNHSYQTIHSAQPNGLNPTTTQMQPHHATPRHSTSSQRPLHNRIINMVRSQVRIQNDVEVILLLGDRVEGVVKSLK